MRRQGTWISDRLVARRSLRGSRVASLLLLGLLCTPGLLLGAGENRIDGLRPDAPELAPPGAYAIGVRTIELVHHNQVDLVALVADKDADPVPRSDRSLTVEVWYPAKPGSSPTPYHVYLRDGSTAVRVWGRAVRGAEPLIGAEPYPLVLISHGYPGNRFLLSHLAENLATKGYVVASIDHTDSTYRTRSAFASTLVNRTLDQRFVLDQIARLAEASDSTQGVEADKETSAFLRGLVDANNTGLVGYSMGGYGAVITAGGGVTQKAVEEGAPRATLAVHRAGTAAFEQSFESRIRAVVAFAPWGMEQGLWDAEGLAGVRVPMLFVAGSADYVSGYQTGTRELFRLCKNVDRYLLTFDNANHNAGAPMPAPVESFVAHGAHPATFFHYADAVWDSVRMNNIAQHFVTAFFGKLLKGDGAMDAYLELVPLSADGVWSVDDSGTPTSEHSYWKGFQNRTAVGLRFEHLPRQPQSSEIQR